MTPTDPTPQDDLAASSFERGRKVIEAFAKSLPLSPGVYRMLNAKGEFLYIGKAKQLQKRVLSYTQIGRLPLRLQRMVAETMSMEATHTNTEAEALMLEANMIRRHLPRYNVLLRDDKSVPYIFLSGDHDFPQLMTHRGPKERKGDYYGPFASTDPVRRTIATLQRVFQLRNCSDAMFAQRTRPCLQYHIKRCTAPCVGKVSHAQYGEQVKAAQQFLEGKSAAVQQMFADKMTEAAARLDYEAAAQYRDRIRALTAVQAHQDINVEGSIDDADVIAVHMDGGQACVQVFFFREGRNYGNKAYFPRHADDVPLEDVLESFVAQFYQSRPCARELLLSHDVPSRDALAEALTTENGRAVHIAIPQRGDKKRLVDFAIKNAQQAHARNMADKDKHRAMLERLADMVDIPDTLERVEVYDNSHLSGTQALGVMVVVGSNGFEKKQYRTFNIKDAMEAGDDYAMMREVLRRRLVRLAEMDDATDVTDTVVMPDLIVLDGGRGQLNAVREVMEELSCAVPLIAISKGPDRNAGREWIHFIDRDSVQLEPTDPLLYFLQRIRDEAHRFAISGQRARRGKQLTKSALDRVPGIGAGRKKALLRHFGSAQAVMGAAVEDLEKVTGISRALAESIYRHFHEKA